LHAPGWVFGILRGSSFRRHARQQRQALAHAQFEALHHDITFPLHAEFDEICNSACPASPVQSQFDLAPTIKSGVTGMINM